MNMKGYFGEYKITVKKGVINLPEKWDINGEVILIGCGDHIEIIQ